MFTHCIILEYTHPALCAKKVHLREELRVSFSRTRNEFKRYIFKMDPFVAVTPFFGGLFGFDFTQIFRVFLGGLRSRSVVHISHATIFKVDKGTQHTQLCRQGAYGSFHALAL